MKAPSNWILVIISTAATATAWSSLPPAAKVIAARPEGTKWEICYEVDGRKYSHFAGATYTQSAKQRKALFNLSS